jgi:hypothetical protein
MLAIMPTDYELSIVKAWGCAAFTTAAAEFRHLQRRMIEKNLVVAQMVMIPNHTPATNLYKIHYLSVTYA